MTPEQMHGEARLQIALAKMEGHQIDKKICRFNDIVQCATRCGMCGEIFDTDASVSGLREAIDACIIGDPMHTGCGPSEIIPEWMIYEPGKEKEWLTLK